MFNKFKKTTSYNIFLVAFIQGFIGLIALVTNIFIVRFFGKSAFGEYSFYFGILSLIILIPIFGTSDWMAKYPSMLSLKLSFRKIFIISIFLSICLLFLAIILKQPFLVFLIPYILIYPIFTVINNGFRGIKNFLIMNVFVVIRYLIYLILILLLYSFFNNIKVLFIIMAIPPLLLIPFLFKKSNLIPKTSSQIISNKKLFFLFLIGLNIAFCYYIDKIALKLFFDFADIGLYTAYANILNILKLVSSAVIIVMIPMAVIRRYKLKESLVKLVAFLVPAAAILAVVSFYVVPWLYGESFILESMALPFAMALAVIFLNIYIFVNSIYVAEVFYNFKFLLIEFMLSLVVFPFIFIVLVPYAGILAMPYSISVILLLKIMFNIYNINLNRA
ncbi:MAG: hypothetical protein U9R08_04710 [Nanoarchaeota archaeon]|nr:hypothetical protein [Nanoarchaeota archaeon]